MSQTYPGSESRPGSVGWEAWIQLFQESFGSSILGPGPPPWLLTACSPGSCGPRWREWVDGCQAATLRRILSTWDEVLHPRQTGLGSSPASVLHPHTHPSHVCLPREAPGKCGQWDKQKQTTAKIKMKIWIESCNRRGWSVVQQCQSPMRASCVCLFLIFFTCHLKKLSPIFQPLNMTVCGWTTYLCICFFSWIGRAFRQLYFQRDPFF